MGVGVGVGTGSMGGMCWSPLNPYRWEEYVDMERMEKWMDCFVYWSCSYLSIFPRHVHKSDGYIELNRVCPTIILHCSQHSHLGKWLTRIIYIYGAHFIHVTCTTWESLKYVLENFILLCGTMPSCYTYMSMKGGTHVCMWEKRTWHRG